MVRIDLAIHKALKVAAAEDGKSIQRWLSELVIQELKKRHGAHKKG